MTDDLGQPDTIIRVVDFEATSLEADASIVEVGWTDLNVTSGQIGPTFSTLCRVDHIPPEARAVHHIRVEETRDFPPFDRRLLHDQAVQAGAYAWAAHNSDFEERFVYGSLPMFCTYKAALREWPEAPSHGLFALLYWLEDQGRVEIDRARAAPPHRSGPDSYATAVVLKRLLDDGVTGRMLWQWTSEPRILPRCPLGDHRGKRWAEVDWGFLEWITRKVDDADIRFNAQLEIDRRRHTDER